MSARARFSPHRRRRVGRRRRRRRVLYRRRVVSPRQSRRRGDGTRGGNIYLPRPRRRALRLIRRDRSGAPRPDRRLYGALVLSDLRRRRRGCENVCKRRIRPRRGGAY